MSEDDILIIELDNDRNARLREYCKDRGECVVFPDEIQSVYSIVAPDLTDRKHALAQKNDSQIISFVDTILGLSCEKNIDLAAQGYQITSFILDLARYDDIIMFLTKAISGIICIIETTLMCVHSKGGRGSMSNDDDRTEVLDRIREYGKNPDLKLPKGLWMRWVSDGVLDMTLSAERIQGRNMQYDYNAFEGWAVAIYSAYDRKITIRLDIDELKYEHYEGNGHLCRSLYRALRFSENYDWFSLGPNVEGHVLDFKKYLQSNRFINNAPKGEAGSKSEHNEENAMEAEFAKDGVLAKRLSGKIDVGDNTIFRQLPIGIFRDVVTTGNEVFTRGKSAIDLWTWNGCDMYIIELKTNKNRKIGIISEIFFYAHCIADLVLPGGAFELNNKIHKSSSDDRGYAELLAHRSEFEKIHGLMLAESFHPLVNDDAVDVLNSGKDRRIEFHLASYER